jgi:hypothetical protein
MAVHAEGRRGESAEGRREDGAGEQRAARDEGRAHAREAATRDVAVLGALLALAAALRLPGLLARGTWDADQGNDMATLQAFVSHGVVPLLGPPTSIGNVHHGAFYYYLLAPAALPSAGRDPLEVVAAVALMGIAFVAVTWWLARSIGGPAAGLVAGLLAAVSATAVSSSTFIWNPNPIPLFAAIALAGAWRAWSTGRPEWWLVAAAGQCMVQQLHVLGILALPALVALYVADLRRRHGDHGPLLRAGVGAVLVIAAGYLPLLASEIQTGFGETRNALAWIASPPVAAGPGLLARLLFVPLRVAAWPLTGLLTDAPVAGVMVVGSTVVLVGWLLGARASARVDDGTGTGQRIAVAWLASYVAVGALLLALLVSSLGTVTPLPNDHYHAFVAPALFTLVGIGAAALWRRDTAGRVLAAVGIGALVAWNLAIQPPVVAPDGGWPAGRAAGVRLAEVAGGQPLAFLGVPEAKPTTAYTYPFELAGGTVAANLRGASQVAVLCDDLFRDVVGAACGGPAEEAAIRRALAAQGSTGTSPSLVARFSPASGRSISVYRLAGP